MELDKNNIWFFYTSYLIAMARKDDINNQPPVRND